MNTEYYFENSNTICCTKKSVAILEEQLKGKFCLECSSELNVITMQEGTFIACKGGWAHSSGYVIECDNYVWEKPPKVVNRIS